MHIRIVVFLLIVCGLSLSPVVAQEKHFDVVTTSRFQGAIVPKENIHMPGQYWTPAKGDILAMEGRIKKFLRSKLVIRHYGQLWRNLHLYKRQYIGTIMRNEKLIYGVFFCNTLKLDWRNTIIETKNIRHPEFCIFEIEYNVRTGKFTNLYVH